MLLEIHRKRTMTFLMLRTMATAAGRDKGLYFQHDEQIFHHAFVIREQVNSSVGRVGSFLSNILRIIFV